jgi:hypothetical protein
MPLGETGPGAQQNIQHHEMEHPMGDEPFSKPRTTSSKNYGHSTNQRQAIYAMERAKMLFGCYRRGDANDPDIYVGAIGSVLSTYEVDLIREVTDPRTGIQTSEKFMTFMPNPGELKVYCDAVAARRERIQRLGALPKVDFTSARLSPPPRQPGDLATVFVPAENVRYPKFVEWTKTADPRLWKFGVSSDNRKGLWISYDTWDLRQAAARRVGSGAELPPRLSLSEEALRAMALVDAERNANLAADEAAE